MEFLRNPEIRKGVVLYLLVAVSSSCLGFLFGLLYGIVILTLSFIYTGLYFLLTYRRYQKIAKLSSEIDRILHGAEVLNMGDYREGELSILYNELSKMTIRLREQAEALRQDKTFLADSIADISHQIKTPLTSINLIVSLLQVNQLPEPRRMELIKALSALLSRIDWLISALLKMSKLDAGTANLRCENVMVVELIQTAAAPLAIPMELREQELHISLAGDETYTGDLSWSVEAVSNILKNCIEQTPIGGRIEISAVENGIFTEIVIRDNGGGINGDDMPHLFERFYKGKNASEQSVGIGLALAQMIVTQQNGTIKAENGRSGGAMFTLRFYKGTV